MDEGADLSQITLQLFFIYAHFKPLLQKRPFFLNKIQNPVFFAFSDDISFVRELFQDTENCVYVENNRDFEDLYLMSRCRHNIVANSTFSFWGAFLNESENQIIESYISITFCNIISSPYMYCNRLCIADLSQITLQLFFI